MRRDTIRNVEWTLLLVAVLSGCGGDAEDVEEFDHFESCVALLQAAYECESDAGDTAARYDPELDDPFCRSETAQMATASYYDCVAAAYEEGDCSTQAGLDAIDEQRSTCRDLHFR